MLKALRAAVTSWFVARSRHNVTERFSSVELRRSNTGRVQVKGMTTGGVVLAGMVKMDGADER